MDSSRTGSLGNDLDEYLAAMEASIPTLTSVKEQSAASAWLAWAKEYRRWSPYGASNGH